MRIPEFKSSPADRLSSALPEGRHVGAMAPGMFWA